MVDNLTPQLQFFPNDSAHQINNQPLRQLQYNQNPQLTHSEVFPLQNQLTQHQFQDNDNSIVKYNSYTEPIIERNNRRKSLPREKPYSRSTERNQPEVGLALSQDLLNLMENTNNSSYSPQPRQLRNQIEMRDNQGDDDLSNYLAVARQNRFSEITHKPLELESRCKNINVLYFSTK